MLITDCLNEVFEFLEEDHYTLHSCLLVNRFWCKVSVRNLWRNVWDFKYNFPVIRQMCISSKILSTLIACLPNDLRDYLNDNGIFIYTPTSKSPLFNYISFCRVLSIHEIDRIIFDVLKCQQADIPQSLNRNRHLVSRAILKMFMRQIPCLKELNFLSMGNIRNISNIGFTYFPGATECLRELSILSCSSDVYSEFFYQLSQICGNIQSISIKFEGFVSHGLKDLISSQKYLKQLSLTQYSHKVKWKDVISLLTSSSDTLTNIKVLVLSLNHMGNFEDFKELQHVTFSLLQNLKFPHRFPECEYLYKFLEINGKNLKCLHIADSDRSLNLLIAKSCPNLRILTTTFTDNEIDTLEIILSNCQQLESIKVWCGYGCLDEKILLEILTDFSPRNFYKLKLIHKANSRLFPKDLEEFFVRWSHRVPLKPLVLIIIKRYRVKSLEIQRENMKVLEKYKKLGVIKKLETVKFDDD
ncbi:13026_t:CDS:1 [Funneliformis geosporum]|uniref:13026_t:CDS:1 n=1 Tax=Funneliformis geosporum TaxID=1117311 RepID=A0A9W4WHN2_9GLOM|nr:13026_t:CDS:1 [Funneliformis geosporum]